MFGLLMHPCIACAGLTRASWALPSDGVIILTMSAMRWCMVHGIGHVEIMGSQLSSPSSFCSMMLSFAAVISVDVGVSVAVLVDQVLWLIISGAGGTFTSNATLFFVMVLCNVVSTVETVSTVDTVKIWPPFYLRSRHSVTYDYMTPFVLGHGWLASCKLKHMIRFWPAVGHGVYLKSFKARNIVISSWYTCD